MVYHQYSSGKGACSLTDINSALLIAGIKDSGIERNKQERNNAQRKNIDANNMDKHSDSNIANNNRYKRRLI